MTPYGPRRITEAARGCPPPRRFPSQLTRAAGAGVVAAILLIGWASVALADAPWSVSPSPSPSSTYNYLDAVTCPSTTSDCWAVGSYQAGGNGGPYYALIEHYDGASWTLSAAPENAGDELYGVQCVDSSDCWAVGNNYSGGTYTSVIDHYDGAAWSEVTAPLTSDSNSELQGVVCTAADDCWAVGLSFDVAPETQVQTTGSPLIDHYDGTSWSVATGAQVTSQLAILQAVTCVNADDCWAVGYANDGVADVALIEHYDGSTWSSVSPPTNAAEETFLYGVTCPAATECWAVGYDYTQDVSIYQPVIEQYNGSAWSIANSPTNGTAEGNFLQGVTCTATADCWAVGYYCNCTDNDLNGTIEAMMEHYDGSAWSLAPTPEIDTPNFGGSDLQGVSCPDANDCVAAGYQWISGGQYVDQPTLIEQMASAPSPGVPEWPMGPWGVVVGLGTAGLVRIAVSRGRQRRTGGSSTAHGSATPPLL